MTRPADPTAVSALRGALADAESRLAYRAWQLRVPGVQYAVLFDGGVQLSGVVGYADAEAGVPSDHPPPVPRRVALEDLRGAGGMTLWPFDVRAAEPFPAPWPA